MSEMYKVEKVEVRVSLTMVDGSTSVGSVFLAPHSKIHGGRQTLEELLTQASHFLPINDALGNFTLIGRSSIAAIRTERGEERELQFVRRLSASMRVAGLGALEGELVMPEVRDYFRVSDYLNGDDVDWLHMERIDGIYWVNKTKVLEMSYTDE